MLKYIELKDPSHRGRAWIARVRVSKSGRTIYFDGKALARMSGGGSLGNHADIETGEEYWVSGVKKTGLDRHWAGGGVVLIEASAVDEYLAHTGAAELDRTRLRVIRDLQPTDMARLTALENQKLDA